MSMLADNFGRGWQNKARHALIHDEAVYVGTNVAFDNTGAIRCRERHALHSEYFSGVTATTPIRNIYVTNVEGVNKQLIYYSGPSGTYRWNSTTKVTTTISTSLTSSRHVSYASVKPVLSDYTYTYITDGVTMLADNGTSTKTWGITPPTGSPSVALSTSSGSLSAGAYSYVYTFYDGATGSESDPSPACASLTVAVDTAIDVSNIETSSDSRVTARRLYRTIADGGTRYLVAIIPDNVVHEYTDTIPDSSLTQAVVTDQGTPPSGDLVVAVKNVLFLVGDTNYHNRGYYCVADNPDNWPSTYYVEAGHGGTVVQNAINLEGTLFFVTKTGVVGLVGSTPDTYDTRDTKADVGTDARWSCAKVGGGIYYKGKSGIYRFDGVRSECVSTPIEKLFWDTPTSLYGVVDESLVSERCRATGYNGCYYIIMPVRDTTGTTANKLLEFNPGESQWRLIGTRLDDVFGDDSEGVLFGSTDYEFSTSSGNSMVYELLSGDTGTTDESISVEFVTKNFDITASPEYPVKSPEVAYGAKARRVTDIAWIKEYRVDATGTWTLEFFMDGVSRYTVTLTGLTISDAQTWRRFDPQLKGRFVYVKVTATNADPVGHTFNEVELR